MRFVDMRGLVSVAHLGDSPLVGRFAAGHHGRSGSMGVQTLQEDRLVQVVPGTCKPAQGNVWKECENRFCWSLVRSTFLLV